MFIYTSQNKTAYNNYEMMEWMAEKSLLGFSNYTFLFLFSAGKCFQSASTDTWIGMIDHQSS